jgi:aspartyl protease family protein
VVDTGATEMVLSQDDALRVGIDPDRLIYSGVAATANGTVRTARVRLNEVALGPITDRNVAVYVNEGPMQGSLLGMGYLQRYDRLEIADGRLILER